MAVSGLPGGMIQPGGGGSIRPPVGQGQQVAGGRPGAQPGIPDGSVVEGLVTGKDGEAYTVRIGAQLMNARSTIALFVGQRFRAVWDASSTPPMLRLQQGDLAVLARFSGRDQQVAAALLSRGLPVNDNTMLMMRQHWMQVGADPAKLGTLAELWARDIPMTAANVSVMAWYMELSPNRAMQIWRRIRERLHERKYSSPKELLGALRGDGDEEVEKFLKAHAMAGKPARKGLDATTLVAPAWWPVDDREEEGVMARVSFAGEAYRGRQVWWLNFELEGNSLGPVYGDVMTNGKALSANIRLKDESKVPFVEAHLPELRADLDDVGLALQHLAVGVRRSDEQEERGASTMTLDMEL